MKIKDITLLSAEEYNACRDKIKLIDGWWWLRSPGSISRLAAYVDPVGHVSMNGSYVNFGSVSVRPALIVECEDGESFEFGGK